MATYQQINGPTGHGCGAACLMVAEFERRGGGLPLTPATERAIHMQCAFPPYNPNADCSPVRLASFATNSYGFNNARIVLSGQVFRRMLVAQYPGELPLAAARGIPVEYWIGWSPRYLPSRNQWVLMVVLCVDDTAQGALRGGALGSAIGGTFGGVIGGAVGAIGGAASVWLYDLARGLGVVGGIANSSLHYVLYRGMSYMDPAFGRDYWVLNRMGGNNRAYWDTGCYVILS